MLEMIINIFTFMAWITVLVMAFKAKKNLDKDVDDLMLRVKALDLQHQWLVEKVKSMEKGK